MRGRCSRMETLFCELWSHPRALKDICVCIAAACLKELCTESNFFLVVMWCCCVRMNNKTVHFTPYIILLRFFFTVNKIFQRWGERNEWNFSGNYTIYQKVKLLLPYLVILSSLFMLYLIYFLLRWCRVDGLCYMILTQNTDYVSNEVPRPCENVGVIIISFCLRKLRKS